MEGPAGLLCLVSDSYPSLCICGRLGCADSLSGDVFEVLYGGASWAAFKFIVDSL